MINPCPLSAVCHSPLIPQFPFIDWAELLEACHSMSKPNSAQEKLVKKHTHGLLWIIVRLRVSGKGYRSA